VLFRCGRPYHFGAFAVRKNEPGRIFRALTLASAPRKDLFSFGPVWIEAERPDGERDRPEEVSDLGPESRWRIDVI